MNKCITEYAKTRYSTKAFDKNKKIPSEIIEKIKELLRYSASSTNAQPWHFILASTESAKEKIAKSTQDFSFNVNPILNSSHVIVFCAQTALSKEHLLNILEQEDKDGRFAKKPEIKDVVHNVRTMFNEMHEKELKDYKHWAEKQVYLNVGAFLLGVATLGVDALPMEGFSKEILNKEFDLEEKGYSATIVIPIGYKDAENDFNVSLPKSRLEYKDILTEV